MKKEDYNKPKLINLGSVAIKTLSGGNGPASDNGNNMMAS